MRLFKSRMDGQGQCSFRTYLLSSLYYSVMVWRLMILVVNHDHQTSIKIDAVHTFVWATIHFILSQRWNQKLL